MFPNASFSTLVDLPRMTLINYAIRTIEQVTEEKDLGVIIDNQMKYHQHVSFATSKAMRMVGVIRKTFCSIPIETFLSLYNKLVRPHMEYGNVIWGTILHSLA